MNFEVPNTTKRTAIVGSTGSGKTFAGVWHLSLKDLDIRAWIIFDFKGDDLLSKLGAKLIDIKSSPPKNPGLYIVKPVPVQDDESVIEFLWNCWSQEYVGIYIDEGYMLGTHNKALIACLTQGRSKHVEMIILSQRPTWMSRFVFSEADYFQIFRLNDRRDYETIQSMISVNIKKRLPPYHSIWYDVSKDDALTLGPVPSKNILIETIRNKISRRPKGI